MSKRTVVSLVIFILSLNLAQAQQAQRGPMRLRLTPADTVVGNNGTVQYKAARSFFRGTGASSGERDVTAGAAFSAANPNLVTFSAITPGQATAAAAATGSSAIAAKFGPSQASAKLLVDATTPTVTSVTVAPAPGGSLTVPRGTSEQLIATASYSDGSQHDVTFESMWSSATGLNVNVVASTGEVQAIGKAASSDSIAANFKGTNGSASVTVGAPVLASRLISPGIAGPIDLGSSQQFQLTDTMSDGTTLPQTTSATWATGAANVATVNSADRRGFATATGGGFTTVSASGVSPAFPAGTMSVNLTALLGVSVPKPRFAFGVNQAGQSISIFQVNAATGELTTVGYIPLPSAPGPMTIEPTGRFAYVPLTSGNLLGFAIDSTAGTLTPVPGSPFSVNVLPKPVQTDAKGKLLIAFTSGKFQFGVQVFAIDQTTGELKCGGNPAGPGCSTLTAAATGINPSSLTVDPSGSFAYVTNQGTVSSPGNTLQSFTLDPVTGNPALASTATTGNSPSALWLHPSGRFGYVTNQTDGTISSFSINGSTGVFTPVATANVGSLPSGVTTDPTGQFIFASNSGSGNVTALKDDGTGNLTAVGTVAAGTSPAGVKVDPQGQFLYVPNSGSNDISTYTINGSTGALTADGTIRAQQGTVSLAILKGNPITQMPSVGYIGNLFSNNISAFYLDPTTGLMSSVPGSPYATGGLNSQNCSGSGGNGCDTGSPLLAIEPTHKFAYLTNSVSLNVSIFNIDPTSGALSLNPASPFLPGVPSNSRLRQALAHPFKEFGYLTNTSGNNCSSSCPPPTVLEAALGSNGVPTPQGSITPQNNGGGGEGAAIDPSGRFLYWQGDNSCNPTCTSNVTALKIDPVTGALTDVLNSPFTIPSSNGGGGPSGLVVDPSGRFVIVPVSNQCNSCTPPIPPGEVVVYKIDTSDLSVSTAGELTLVSNFQLPAGEDANSVAVDPTGRFVYVGVVSQSNQVGPGSVKVFSLDSSGNLTDTGNQVATVGFVTVWLEPSGKFAYVLKGFLPGTGTDNVSVFTVDPTTGALSSNIQNFSIGASGSAGMTILRRAQ